MYFNNKNNTNIDDEFNGNNNILLHISNFFSKDKKIFFVGIVVIILLAVMLLLFSNRKLKSYLILNGDEVVTIYQGSDYLEPGYNAYNSREDDLTNKVTIESNLNNNVIGEYEITYKIGDVIKVRYVNVIERPKDYLFIHLTSVNNSVDVYLQKGQQYKEPGYIAITTAGKDLTNKVTVTGKVDTSKKGIYKLTYSIIDSNNVEISATRKVIVMDSEISLTLDNEDYTNTDVTINAFVIDEYFDYMILPNNEKVTTNVYSYKVNNNGTYIFKTYSKKDGVKESSIKVSNIDKIAPSGSCIVDHDKHGSFITMNISDKSGISKYQYNNKMYTGNKIVLNKYINTAEIVAYDNAGNSNKINCKVLQMKDELFVDTSHYTDMTGFNVYDVKVAPVDLTNLGCNVTYSSGSGRYMQSIMVHQKIGENFHGILTNVCKYVNESPWINEIQTAGAYVNRQNIGTDYHAMGLAIDLNNEWTYTFNGKKYRPYPDQGEWTWHVYNEFICDVCDGKEDCEYNVNYIIWKRYFEGNGWCWYGNKAGIGFDPMHYEIRVNNDCGTIRTEKVSCD